MISSLFSSLIDLNKRAPAQIATRQLLQGAAEDSMSCRISLKAQGVFVDGYAQLTFPWTLSLAR